MLIWGGGVTSVLINRYIKMTWPTPVNQYLYVCSSITSVKALQLLLCGQLGMRTVHVYVALLGLIPSFIFPLHTSQNLIEPRK